MAKSFQIQQLCSQAFSKVILLVAQISMLMVMVKGQAYVQLMTPVPDVVQAQNADLAFKFMLSKPLKAGSWLKLSFPAGTGMTVSKDVKDCKESDGQFTVTKCEAHVEDNYLQFTIDQALTLTEGATTAGFEIAASTAVNLPTTTARVDPISLSTEAAEVRATVFTATAGTLAKVSLAPVAAAVGRDTTLQVSLTTAHVVPKQGLLQIGVSAPWNDGAPGASIPYFSAIECTDFSVGGKTVPNGVYACSFWDDQRAGIGRVDIKGGFEDGVPANTEIKINIAGFRNPMSAKEAFKVFTVYTTGPGNAQGQEANPHVVDTVQASVTVTEPAVLTGAALRVARKIKDVEEAKPGIVQEENIMELRFSSPVPLRVGCQVSYWFPSEFYDAAQIVDVRTGALFAETNEHHHPAKPSQQETTEINKEQLPGSESIGSKFTLKEEAGGYKSVSFSSCTTFRGHRAPEVTRILGLKQPRSTQPTPSLQVHIMDVHGEPIAAVTSGVTFTPVTGGLTIKPPILSKSVVSSLASLSWTIVPDHALAGADSPSVTVKLPVDYIVQSTCEVPPSKGATPTPRKCTVSQVENSITIEHLVEGNVKGGTALTFTTGPVSLPGTVAGGQGAFQVTTYINEIALDGTASATERYGVDTGTDKGLVQLEPGAIKAPSVTPSSSQAMALTEYTFSVTPEHRIPQYGLIMVQYPPQVAIEDSSLSQTLCRGEYTGKETEKALIADQKAWKNFPAGAAVCTIFSVNRTLIVNKGFQTGHGGPGGATSYSWILPYVSNPPNLAVSDSFIVTTRDQFFSVIDEAKTGVTVQMTQAAEFRQASVTLGSYTNGQRTSYSFSLAAAAPIKPSDYILVSLPDACELPDDEAELACTSKTTEFIDKLTCTKSSHIISEKLQSANPSSGKAVLVALTAIREIPALETFSFDIQMIMNPNSTRPTEPVRVQVFDSVALTKAIHADSGGLQVITSVPWSVGGDDTSIESSVQGAGLATVYTLTMSLEHSLAAGGGLLIRYPPQVINVGKLTVHVDASEYGCPEALTSPEIDDSARQILFVTQSFSTPLVVKQQEAATATKSGGAGNTAGKSSTSSKNSGAGGGSGASSSSINFQASATANTPEQKGVGKATSEKKKKTQKLTITIRGLGNPYNNEASSSFEIVTFDTEKKPSGTVLYFVDRVADGLTIDSPCAYPCKECASGDPRSCLACFSTSAKPFLQEQTCLAQCSDGRYFDAATNRCELCDSTCLTCKGTPKTCTSCGVREFLHLRGEECVIRCGDGYVDDPSNNLCLKCRDGCSTCSVSTTNCTSCDTSSSTPWNFRFDCLATCPAEIGIEKGTNCLECAAQCKTCANKPDHCTTCEPHMRFDPLNHDCLEVCQADTQIYAPSMEEGKDGQKGVCQTCHEDCRTCVGDVNTCTSCQPGFVLNLDSTCQTTCPKPQNLVKGGVSKKVLEQGKQARYQAAVDGTCRECEVPCLRCHGQADTCTACTTDFLLYKGTCIDHCPDKYWNETVIGRDNEPVNQCILVGLICPEGFHVNDAGEGCVPNEFECKDGYEINEKRTACIPAPGSPVPFPFLFTAICMGLVVAGSYMKEKEGTKIFTCLVFLISSMELLEYLLIAVFAALLEEVFASLLAFVAVSVLVASNIVFSIGYRKYTMNDRGYADWIRLFPKTRMLLPVICALINFTSVRFVFSGFFGLENCLASFHEPRTSVHKHLQTLTYVKYVFVYIPIFLADLIIFSSVGWGHQLLVLAMETFLLQLFMIFLTYKEFQDPAKLYADGEGEYSPLKPRRNGHIAVMGAFEDEGMDETHLVRQNKGGCEYEVALRKKALTAILQQVGENFFTSQKKGVDIGGEISKVFSKFDKNQLKLRRAFSLEDLSAEPTNGTDGTVEDEESDESAFSMRGAALVRRHSFPMLGGIEDDVADPFFREQLDKIKEAVLEDSQKDNVYAEVKPETPKTQHQKKKKLVNRRTQTYLRELLQLDGEDIQDSDMEIVMEEEAEIDDQYTKGIIKDLIEGLSESSHRDDLGAAEKKKAKRGQEPLRPIPDFEFADIMGEFEIDDAGNYIILRGEAGELLDRNERPVNKRGYLVDKLGNIVNTKQEIILMASELDSDEEIPASYGFEKRKQTLLNMGNDQQFQVHTYGQGAGKELQANEESQNDEEIVERQFNQLKQEGEASGHDGSQIEEPLAGDQNFMIDEHGNIDDMIDIITRQTVPVRKDNLKQHRTAASPGAESRGSSSRPPKRQLNNAAGKRFRPVDQMYFPGEASQGRQQQKLFQIAESIGGFASQVADNMTGGNLDVSEIGNRSQQAEPGGTSHQPARPGAHQRGAQPNELLPGKKAPAAIMTSDFYASGANPDGTQSVLSQDIVFMHEALAARPGGRPGKHGPKDFGGQAEPGQLRKVYGTIRADQSPKRAASKGRADGQGARLFSADPRLRGLENIYLSKFSHVGSQRNVGLKKPFQMKKQMRGGLQAHDRTGADNQRQVVVAETIERLEQAYSAGGPAGQPTQARRNFGNASFVHSQAHHAGGGPLAESQSGRSLTPVRAQNWLGEDVGADMGSNDEV